MERDLRIWLVLTTVFLALLILIQISVIAFLIQLSNLLKLTPGKPGLREMAARVVETIEAMHRTTKTTAEILSQLKPTLDEAVIVSRRQLAHADHVVGDILDGAERINQAFHKIALAFSLSFTEAHALSAGFRSAAVMLFRKGGYLDKRKQC